MSGFVIKGWCPSALRPMLSGDGLVVRIRPPMARLTTAQAQGIACAALRHGSGLIDLTARANLQLRGIRPAAHLALLDDLDALELLDNDEAQTPNLTVSPFWTADHWHALATTVTNLLNSPDNSLLPAKFGVSLDLDEAMVLQAVSSDIRIEWHPKGWLIRPDGFASGCVVQGQGQAVTALRRLLAWFRHHGIANRRGRMADLKGRTLPDGFDHAMSAVSHDPIPGPHPLGYLVGLQFGQIRAETLAEIAVCAMRITPWRMILLEGCHTAPVQTGPAHNAPAQTGLITDPADPILRVTACTGAPGCPQGQQPTRDLARILAPQVPPGQHLHISGCAKGCAHPAAADVTLCGTSEGFDLIRNGRAGDPPLGRYDAATTLFKAV